MPIQLTSEQQQRIRAVVASGAYQSPEQALDAAVTAVETVAHGDFDDTNELEHLLAEGLNSGELSEEEFWRSIEMKLMR